MKKIFIMLILIGCCLQTVSCENSNKHLHQKNNDEVTTYSNEVTEDLETESFSEKVEVESFSKSKKAQIFIRGKMAYNLFVLFRDLPSDFVFYSDISLLGKFKQLNILSSVAINDFSSYMYTIKDKANFELILYVQSLESVKVPPEDLNKIEQININLSDMRTISSEINGVYCVDDIWYSYISGKLNSVSWQKNGKEFTVYADSLYEYPDNSFTFTGRMLNAQTANSAIEELYK